MLLMTPGPSKPPTLSGADQFVVPRRLRTPAPFIPSVERIFVAAPLMLRVPAGDNVNGVISLPPAQFTVAVTLRSPPQPALIFEPRQDRDEVPHAIVKPWIMVPARIPCTRCG